MRTMALANAKTLPHSVMWKKCPVSVNLKLRIDNILNPMAKHTRFNFKSIETQVPKKKCSALEFEHWLKFHEINKFPTYC